MPDIYLDDLKQGQVFALGQYKVTHDEITDFARQWDPQPFHIDDNAAKGTIFGQVIASGWHTACIFMRLFANGLLNRAAASGSPGLDELRWQKPVFPDDTLEASAEILEVKPSRSKPDRGAVRIRCSVSNQDDDEVLSMTAIVLFHRRPSAYPIESADDDRA
ncbi:MAG: MaoC family dehydratase [Pseudomonadota bacterium]